MTDREAFEAWWGAKYVSQSPEEDQAWEAWQAALASERAKQAEPIQASILVTMYAENPTGDADMIEFAREVERAHGIGAAPPAVQGEPMSDSEMAALDSVIYGGYVTLDGKRIDPTSVYAPPADDEAVKLLREAKDYLDRWEARPRLQLAIDAYLAKVKT